MGLDTTHDAFSGAYSSFNRFRQAVAKCTGGSFPPHEGEWAGSDESRWYFGPGYFRKTHPGLAEFFDHSDCDGVIEPEMCEKVADELEALIPEIKKMGEADGHLARAGGYAAVLTRFVKGCHAAAAAGEPLEFF